MEMTNIELGGLGSSANDRSINRNGVSPMFFAAPGAQVPITTSTAGSSPLRALFGDYRKRSKLYPLVCFTQTAIILFCALHIYNLRQSPTTATTDSLEATTSAPPAPNTFFLPTNGDAPQSGATDHKSAHCRNNTYAKLLGTGCFPSARSADKISECDKLKLPSLRPEEASRARRVVTSKSGAKMRLDELEMELPPCLEGAACDSQTELTIYPDQVSQIIIGWGGALTDSSIHNIMRMDTNASRQLLDAYFGKNGLMYSMARVSIGGSDFSTRFYTNDDLPSGETDVGMNSFRLVEEDLLQKIPVLKFIQSTYREVKVFGSIWSPPVWMKTNGHFNKGQLKGSIDPDPKKKDRSEQYYAALAELKRRFVTAYQDNGIKMWGLTVLNEPMFAMQPFLDFNSMVFPPADYASYIAKYLGPLIRNDPKLKHLKLMVHDDNRRLLMNFTDPVLSAKGVRKFIDGISVHGYIDEDYHLMDTIMDKHRNNDSKFFILPTELCSGHLPFMQKAKIGDWDRGMHYALDITRSLQHQASGWVDWNMALDHTGGPGWLGGKLDSPAIVLGDDGFVVGPMFYAIGHFSRFVPTGARRVNSTLKNAKFDYPFETVSFQVPYGLIVTVLINSNPYPIKLNIRIEKKVLPRGARNGLQIEIEPESFTTIAHL